MRKTFWLISDTAHEGVVVDFPLSEIFTSELSVQKTHCSSNGK